MATAETPYDKELKRWNTLKRDGGMRPNGFEEFPRMVYRARRKPGGGPFLVIDPMDELWSAQNYLTVGNRGEQERAFGEGFRLTPADAIAHQIALEDAISDAAAEEAARVKRMGEKAREEYALVDASTSEHVADVTGEDVAQAKRKPGRPRTVPA